MCSVLEKIEITLKNFNFHIKVSSYTKKKLKFRVIHQQRASKSRTRNKKCMKKEN